MMGQRFPSVAGTSRFLSLCPRHILEHTFSAQPGCLHSVLTFTSCLNKTLGLARGESQGSGLYTACVQPGHAHSPKYTQGLLDFQEHACVFESPLWTSHSLAFLCKLFVCLLFALLFVASGSHDVKQLQLIVFDNYSWGKGCSHWVPGQVKQASPCVNSCMEPGQMMPVFWEWGPEEAPTLFFSSLQWLPGCWFSP